jgi:hypothetical protein
MQFSVVSPFQAVSLAVRKERFVTIPVGAIVETSVICKDRVSSQYNWTAIPF